MIRYRLLFICCLLISVLGALGLWRLEIDTDVIRSLPSGDRVISDGLAVFEHHPVHDQIAVDIAVKREDPDALVAAGSFLEKKMRESGLFSRVGTGAVSELIPELALSAARHLPLLFSRQELEEEVKPLITTEYISLHMGKVYQDLGTMAGIGQAAFIGIDPLGLKDLILARMAPLAPSLNSRFYRGSLLSADGLHLLVTAKPLASGTDTGSARAISELISAAGREIDDRLSSPGQQILLTPVGGYRAALDNEKIIRHDVQLALVLATAGIGLLLLFAFSRPLIGLLSLVPAFAGVAAALFVYSLFHPSISIMVLGFGGGIISITVDHGIAYLLFLDRAHRTSGKDASTEVRAVGIMAVITSIGAFLILGFSGFPIFTELGQFTALGIFFSFIFVHSVFPKIFPVMVQSRGRSLPLRGLVNRLYGCGWRGAILAAAVGFVLLLFARPQFLVSLSSMNTVSQQTLAADALFTRVWGNISERIFMLNFADSVDEIQQNNDLIMAKIEQDIKKNILTSGFVPSMIFPGKERGSQNLSAWRDFWAEGGRRQQVVAALQAAGLQYGFTADAFADFMSLLDPSFTPASPSIPSRYYSLLGISENEKEPGLLQFITVQPGEKYDGDSFLNRYGKNNRIFDADFFTERLADILFSTFVTMFKIIVVSVSLLLFFFYFNLPLTLLTLLPPFFAYICTLGTLNIIGHPLDIPALMLSIIVFGMGVDYSIFCVRAHQRYREINHSSYIQVRVAVFMAGGSTLVGFGVLSVAEHSLLRSIGLTSFLGIGYSLLGTFLLLPPLLEYYFSNDNRKTGTVAKSDIARIRHRFKTVEAYPKMFARFKLQFDPMFDDLPGMLALKKDIRTIVDIGCGYGVPACWCLEQYSEAELFAVDPDPERVRLASLVVGDRGTVTAGWAPDFPSVPKPADLVLLLDMLHYLDDETVTALLEKSFTFLVDGGLLVTRFVIEPDGSPSWSWRLEDWRVRSSCGYPRYRSSKRMAELLENSGFHISLNEVSPANGELVWMVGLAVKGEGDVE
ncbi:MAG: MMPL family transporter [Deltaproteobacteria bacterium]|nr:MMPL family transporter [Deltaproteobacteria bacterium]